MTHLLSPSCAPDRAEVRAEKFRDPDITANGQARAQVVLHALTTLWINTGTQCNITCTNCYIKSSPTNDRLVYTTPGDIQPFLDECAVHFPTVTEIGFTGGEPFLNPDCPDLLELALTAGYSVLVLTNAMQPMMRPRVQARLLDLKIRFGRKLKLRISIDHPTEEAHDAERGAGAWVKTWRGIQWLADNGFALSVAGRLHNGEAEAEARAKFADLFRMEHLALDAADWHDLTLFPEMDEAIDTPEISTACWEILGVSPQSVMCASSRMIIKRKHADKPSVIACTLLPDDPQFDLGPTLKGADKPVKLNHPHCSRFCVLGGASCSG